MNILIVNSISHCYELILYLNSRKVIKTLYKNEVEESKDNIVILLDTFLKKCNFNIKDLNFIGAITGPGSYTGLRVGLSLVNNLGLALNIPIIGVSLFDILIHVAKKETSLLSANIILTAVPTYKGGMFGQLFNSNLKPISRPLELLEENLSEYIVENKSMSILTTDLFLAVELGLDKVSLFQKQVDITTENINNTILAKYKENSKKNNYPLEVLYIKVPNITIKKD